MKKCPRCKTRLPDEVAECAVCGYEFPNNKGNGNTGKEIPQPQVKPVLIVTLAVFAAAFLIEIAVYINI